MNSFMYLCFLSTMYPTGPTAAPEEGNSVVSHPSTHASTKIKFHIYLLQHFAARSRHVEYTHDQTISVIVLPLSV